MKWNRFLAGLCISFSISCTGGCESRIKEPPIPSISASTIREADMDPEGLKVYVSSRSVDVWRVTIYQKKKFSDIERGVSKLVQDHSRSSWDKLEKVYTSLGAIQPDVDLMAQKAILDAWAGQSSSHVPLVVRGVFETKWAWAARGGGWGKDIARESAETFKQRLTLSKTDLEKAAALEPRDPFSKAFLIETDMGLGGSRQQMDAAFQSAIALDPGNVTAYTNRLRYLLPQWFGSDKEAFAAAEEARKHIDQNPDLGSVWVAAYVYQAWYPNGGKVLLHSPDIWKPIETWYHQSIARDPADLKLRANFASTALLARQNDSAIEQFDFIGDRWVEGTRWINLKTYNHDRAKAYYARAKEYQNTKNFTAAEQWFRKSIRLGYAPSIAELGWLYSNGTSLPLDTAQSISLLTRATTLGDAHAANNLGWAYQEGKGVTQDFVRAAELYKVAGEKGLALAQTNLAWLYLEGHGVAKNYEEAKKWYQLAAVQGNANAIANIGWMHESGFGYPKDVAEAARWYRQAASLGSQWAVNQLTKLGLQKN